MMQLVTLDFETFYSQEYSLKRMTTEAYVRDPQFKVHMVGIKEQGAGAHTYPDLVLQSIDWARTALICHHAQFDGLILSHHYGIKPALWLDTLSMSRYLYRHAKSHSLDALAERLGLGGKDTTALVNVMGVRKLSPEQDIALIGYCRQDVEKTEAACLAMLPLIPRSALKIMDTTIRMFTEPVLRLDRPRLEAYHAGLVKERERVLQDLGVGEEDMQSAAKFSTIIQSLGYDVPMKPSTTTPDKFIPALAKTDKGMTELLEHEDPRVQALAAARLRVKSTIDESRAERLLDMSSRGALPVYLTYAGAHTLRWSGGDSMNWQNFPNKGDIRSSIMAPKGYRLIVGDLSQIECRILNYLAGQDDVIEAFRQGRDIYSENASRFYSEQVTKKDKVKRHLGKTIELGCGYGMGDKRFKETCRRGALGGPPIILTDTEAQRAVGLYRDTHARVALYWKQADHVLQVLYSGGSMAWGPFEVCDHRIYGPGGSFLDYSNLEYADGEFWTTRRNGRSRIYGAKVVENVVQWAAWIVLCEAINRIGNFYRLILTVHDELVYCVPEEEADEALDFILTEMKRAPAWLPGIPLDAEGSHDVRYNK